jgi:hypothetical protein
MVKRIALRSCSASGTIPVKMHGAIWLVSVGRQVIPGARMIDSSVLPPSCRRTPVSTTFFATTKTSRGYSTPTKKSPSNDAAPVAGTASR